LRFRPVPARTQLLDGTVKKRFLGEVEQEFYENERLTKAGLVTGEYAPPFVESDRGNWTNASMTVSAASRREVEHLMLSAGLSDVKWSSPGPWRYQTHFSLLTDSDSRPDFAAARVRRRVHKVTFLTDSGLQRKLDGEQECLKAEEVE
jgi:hypothetical protein